MTTNILCENDRVSALIPIQVSWTGRKGQQFDGAGKTLTISRNGATIVLPHKLVPVQEITVRRNGTAGFAAARVVGLIGEEAEGHIYGVAFLDSSVNIWDIELPPETEREKEKSPLYLECACCLARRWVDLDEIQIEVIQAQHIINLYCKPCASWTVWGLASHETSSKSGREDASEPSSAPVPRGENERKHTRVHMNIQACLRHPGNIIDEEVRVRDVSRGGFRFVSQNYHPNDSEILVAMPYTRNASNVFVPARIVWRKDVRHMERYEYGVTYSHSPKRARHR